MVARDFGFAPNPFFEVCTLATCKPKIRKNACVGDWIVGTGSAAHGRTGRLVFAMKVQETLSFSEYWHDERFLSKRPSMRGSKKQGFGDNIYHRATKSGKWIQADSHHSHEDGTPNYANVKNDTSADRVLAAKHFVYWGGSGPQIPKKFRHWSGTDICALRGHKVNFPTPMVDAFVNWIEQRGEWGLCGLPLEWKIHG